MEKEFIPYGLALRLKQLGFNERCFKYEDAKKICENHEKPGGCPLPNVHCGYPNCTIDSRVEPLAIPIWQQAFKWFREKYFYISYVCAPYKEHDEFYFRIRHVGDVINEGQLESCESQVYKIYEEAEAACLEKLIEIVEQSKSR